MLVQAGLADRMVPHEQSVMVAKALRSAGTPGRLDLLPGARHIAPVFDRPANLSVVTSFLDKALARPEEGRRRNRTDI